MPSSTRNSRLALVAATMICAAIAGAAEKPANLLRNPGAEQLEGDQPAGWFAAGVPHADLRMWRDAAVARSGQASLAVANEHEYGQIVCNNWSQELTDVPLDATIRLDAYVKTEGVEHVNLCIQCWDRTRENMVAFGSSEVIRGECDWSLLRTELVWVPPDTASIIVRAVLTGKGRVWFDDLCLAVVAKPGGAAADRPRSLVRNPSAERAVDGEPLHWFTACVAVEGLWMWRAIGEAHTGAASLAISNQHDYDQIVCNNWSQRIADVPMGEAIRLSGWVKTRKAEIVNLCFSCMGPHGQLAFRSTPVVSGDQDWRRVETPLVNVPRETTSILVRAVLSGTGQAWFDDLTLETVTTPGTTCTMDPRLLGAWVGLEPARSAHRWTAVFCANTAIIVNTAGEGGCGTGWTDASQTPHLFSARIGCACPDPDTADRQIVGIYKIEGDTLTLCCNTPGGRDRPGDFDALGARTIVFKRPE